MTDMLKELKTAMDRATPTPDAAHKTAVMAQAAEAFDAHQARQGSAPQPRPTADRPSTWAGIRTGVGLMFSTLTSRPALTASTALVAVGMAAVLPVLRDAIVTPPVIILEEPADLVDRVIQPEEPAIATDPLSVGQDTPVTIAAPAQNLDVQVTSEKPATVADAVAQPDAPGVTTDPVEVGPDTPVAIAELGTRPESPVPSEEPIILAEPAEPLDRPNTDEVPVIVAAPILLPEAPADSGPVGKSSALEEDVLSEEETLRTALEDGAMASIDVVTPESAEAERLPAPVPLTESHANNTNFQPSTGGGVIRTRESYAMTGLGVGDTAPAITRVPNTEAFANEEPNPVKVTREAPLSTFSIDVDTASYSVVRSSLVNGQMPPAEAVRVEEMVNYFPYTYPAPGTNEAPFRPTVTVSQTPWNPDTQLMHIALQGRMPALQDRPPLNLVFLIDTSGSMDEPDKLPLLKQSFRLMLTQLQPEDEVAIVTYAGTSGLALKPTPARESKIILSALNRLEPGGSTAGQAGLQHAYSIAESMYDGDEVSRIILATDGDFNVGLSDPQALKDYIAEKRDSGTFLSVLGFGRGNLDDATMQALAQNGNGQAAYIDTLAEAQKVLVDQLSGALFPIASDVKVQIEFNPATIAEYRLIGYETRALRREDFNNDRVDAGEIGAGHSVTALYELTPVGSPAIINDPLVFQDPETVAGSSDDLAFLRLRYKEPGASESQLIEVPIGSNLGRAGPDARFAAAIAGFGQLLRDGRYMGDWTYANAIALAESALGADPYGYRREAITLMRLAESLSQ